MSTARAVAVISTGEMGGGVARLLREAGLRVVTALNGRGERTRARAAAAGVEDAGSVREAARQADVLLSILPPRSALDLARAVGRDAGPLYVDCNAVSPMTARRIGAVVGERFVDAGIVGGADAPRFYASGPHAAELAGLPLDVRVLHGEIGQASGLKMCYAALTKGLMALITESTVTAEALGVAEALYAELADSQPQFLAQARRGLPGMVPKAHRWIAEMEEIAATFAASGLTPRMLEGAADVYRFVDAATTEAAPPTSSEEARFRAVIAALTRSLAPRTPVK